MQGPVQTQVVPGYSWWAWDISDGHGGRRRMGQNHLALTHCVHHHQCPRNDPASAEGRRPATARCFGTILVGTLALGASRDPGPDPPGPTTIPNSRATSAPPSGRPAPRPSGRRPSGCGRRPGRGAGRRTAGRRPRFRPRDERAAAPAGAGKCSSCFISAQHSIQGR